MILDIEIDNDIYQCKRLSAVDAFKVGHMLGQHNLIFLAANENNAYCIIAGLLGIDYDDALEIATMVSKGAVRVSPDGGEPTPVSLKFFQDDITVFFRLAAELIIKNFHQLSTYLLVESNNAEKASKQQPKPKKRKGSTPS